MYLVFDCGGNKTRMGISADGQAIKKSLIFNTNKDFDEQIEKIRTEGEILLDGQKPVQVSGGIAGIWNKDKSKLYKSPHLPDYDNKPIKKKLEKIFDCGVTLGNDVEMEGLGEANFGAGRRKSPVVMLSVGTGVGGVKIDNGTVSQNEFGFEPGHMILDVDGGIGYFEDFVSGSAMERIYGRKPQNIDDPEVWNRETQLLAIGIHNLIVLWSPQIVILAGGVMNKIDPEKLKSLISVQMKVFPNLPEIKLGELGDKAGLYGSLIACNR
jgi:predicted NBD/HSP70 family sugar kinase